MSVVPQAATVTPEHRSKQIKPEDDRPVVILTARFPLRANARRGEDRLGTLCADGGLDVLDGAVVDWPPDAPAPVWRPLRNLPRISALNEAAWACALQQCTAHQPTHTTLPPLAAGLARGNSAVIAICITPPLAQIRDELTEMGATVHTSAIRTGQYAELRNAYGRA